MKVKKCFVYCWKMCNCFSRLEILEKFKWLSGRWYGFSESLHYFLYTCFQKWTWCCLKISNIGLNTKQITNRLLKSGRVVLRGNRSFFLSTVSVKLGPKKAVSRVFWSKNLKSVVVSMNTTTGFQVLTPNNTWIPSFLVRVLLNTVKKK